MSASDELRELTNLHADGRISQQEADRLSELLKDNPENQRAYLLIMHLHADLGREFVIDSDLAVDEDIDPPLATRRRPRRKRPPRKKRHPLVRRPSVIAAASAVILLGVMLAWHWSQRDSPSNAVVTILQLNDVRWTAGSSTAVSGDELPATRLKLEEGAVLIEFANSARAVLEAPVDLEIVDASTARLHAGRLTAHVPPAGRGFTVQMGELQIVDQGTDFGLMVDRDSRGAPSEVHVFEGEVEVRGQSPDPQIVRTGSAFRFSGGQVEEIAVDRSAFLLEEEFSKPRTETVPPEMDRWKLASERLTADPDTLFHATLNEQRLPQGTVNEADWTNGRWPEKAALRFVKSDDQVRIQLEKSTDQVSLLAWVSVRQLSASNNVLMASNEPEVGSLNWLLTSDGELRLEIGRDLGAAQLDWEAVNSEPIISQLSRNRWIMLATTFDGQVIRHYVDGMPCGEGRSFQPPTIQFGAISLGHGPDPAMVRLNGELDEFAILGRVMTAFDVKAYFEQGRP